MRVRCHFLLLLLAGCASARGTAGTFEHNLGTASAADLREMTNRIIAMHRFEVEQDEGPPNILVQTRWQNRRPWADEQQLGVGAAQIRATIRARPRSTTSALGEVFTVQMSIEQRVRLMGSEEWIYELRTAQAREHAERIFNDLKQLLEVGVRRY